MCLNCLPVALRAPAVIASNMVRCSRAENSVRTGAQTALRSAETAAMLFWALLATSQTTMRKGDGWKAFGDKRAEPIPVDLAA